VFAFGRFSRAQLRREPSSTAQMSSPTKRDTEFSLCGMPGGDVRHCCPAKVGRHT
jgi:hypothetical protein